MSPPGPVPDLRSRWFPIAASQDLVRRHVFHGQLLKQELAVWRSDSGAVNVWENRCLHRGVRLSIGLNLGRELQCQYHGWRYADGTAACTYIPAHPANAPARTIRNRTYPALERCGLVWSRLDDRESGLGLPEAGVMGPVFRAIPIDASAGRVSEALAAWRFAAPEDGRPLRASPIDPSTFRIAPETGAPTGSALLFVQPVDDNRCTLRGLFETVPQVGQAGARLWHINQELEALRDVLETRLARDPTLAAPQTRAEVPLSPPVLVVPDAERRLGGLIRTVRVRRKWATTADIVALALEPTDGALPPAIAGAHIDLILPNGLVRQYSPIDPAGETGTLTLGIKREEVSRGGSAALHDSIREGDLLAIGPPRDNFSLRPADRHVLVAGGVGVTPLLAMARTLRAADRPHRLHLFARSLKHVPFADLLGEDAALHLGLDPAGTASRLATVLREPRPGDRLYVCGPAPMIAAACSAAAAAGWPDARVHVEHFANTRVLEAGSTFEVALARSALTVSVPAERTIVDVLAEHGVDIPTSCSQGACGTCLVTVLEGEPDHRDVFLSRAEQASNTCMTPCVSRARSARLVLDI